MSIKIHNKKLKKSSKRWLERQLSDPFVAKAKALGYRSRAAFKILEIEDKFKLVNSKSTVVDLGAAPGGWSQVISPICKKVVAIDLLDIDPISNVDFIKGDFLNEITYRKLLDILDGQKVDLVMSDMAPNTCGNRKADHLRIMNLLEAVYDFCKISLKENGSMVAKVFQGGTEHVLLRELNRSFSRIVHFKPDSSRKESPEIYLIAIGFRGENFS